MDRAEAIERFEKQLTAAQVILDTGFGASPGENNRLYVVRKEMAAIALEALREQELERNSHDVARACEWISVNDRLPEQFVSVLGYCPDEEPLPAVHECYMNCFGQWTSAQVYGMENVTHWMPLPEPPEEGETQ